VTIRAVVVLLLFPFGAAAGRRDALALLLTLPPSTEASNA